VAAGDHGVVAPDDLAGLGSLDDGLAAGGGVAGIGAVGADQSQRGGVGDAVSALSGSRWAMETAL
jgi:hypothetical protein